MNDQKITIDVLIPVYNSEKYIEKCLNSLFNQTYKNLRIVVVDDGSSDGSLKLLNEIKKNHSNLEVYTKENAKSISKTRNYLLTKIKSPFFTFFDSDDYAEENYIEELYNLLVRYNADISLCGRSWHSEKKSPNLKKQNKNIKDVIFMNKQECLAEMISSKMFNGTVYCKLFRSDLAKNVEFDPNIHYGEDLNFCYKIMKKANNFVMTQKKLYHYIIRKGSIVSSKFKESKLTCLTAYEEIIEDVKDNQELYTCARSMHGLIAVELLYYTWRDKYKNKDTKKHLKKIIAESIPFIKQNKRLLKINRCLPYVWKLTKIM